MYWRRLRPYIIELLVFLAIMTGFSSFFMLTECIIFEWSAALVLFVILVLIWLVQYVFSFIPFALLVITDLMLKNYSTITAIFIEQFIFKSSSFLDKNGKHRKKEGIEKVETLFYKVVVKTKEGVQVFTSSEYFELESNTSYEFVFGRKSKALVDIKPMAEE